MAQYRVDVSEPAENDLKDIVRYIASQLSAPVSALRMMELLEEAMASLSDMPQRRCPLVADERLSQMGYRKLPMKDYIVFFSIDEKNKVFDVERILYGRRDWLRIL
jgi:toxin ParE1/3/4